MDLLFIMHRIIYEYSSLLRNNLIFSYLKQKLIFVNYWIQAYKHPKYDAIYYFF